MPWRPITDCLGYILYGKRSVYFAGDTDLFDGMADIGQRVDVALLPVWGWGPTLGAGHMDPYRAARAVQLLQPSLVIPIHWGTYFPSGLRPIMPQFVAQPPYDFARYANQITPEVQVCVLDPGDALDLTGFFSQMGTR
jgi:L-ascorbate metabolism protein UlaG (beta-lactamase superfamily)